MSFQRTSFLTLFFLYLFSPINLYAHHDGYTPTGLKSIQEEETISSGAMLNSPTASTLGRNHFSAGFAFDYSRYNSIPAENAHELHEEERDIHGKNHEESYNFDLGYGISKDLNLILVAPIVFKNSVEIEDEENLGLKERSTGFGDMRFIGKYRFLRKYVESALIAGVKFPTGRTTAKRKSGEKFEAELQPGSGSWDGEFGIVFSRNFKKRFSAATSFQYFLKTSGAQEHEAGDVFRYNLGGSYSLRPLGKYPNLSVVCELNNEWALKDRSRTESRVFDSGGTTVFLTPGLNANLTKFASIFWAMPIPIYQNLGGEHEELKLEILAGINFYI